MSLISIDVRGWVGIGFSIFVLPVGVAESRRLWHYKTAVFDKRPGWWLWNDTLWHAYVRVIPTCVISWFSMMTTYILGALAPSTVEESPIWLVALMPSTITFVASGTFLVTIVLINEPARFVPPHLRGQPGALAEWRESRR